MTHVLDCPLTAVARALRRREVSAAELTDEALRRHAGADDRLRAYKHVDPEGARAAAGRADDRLARDGDPPPFCGIPVSVKDLYGVEGMPTFAGTVRALPERWTRDAWLVSRLRAQGAVFVGKTHTVEMAYGAVGVNPNHDTPRNPWDARIHRIPGGSSSGAGVSLWEGSALVALGSDTGGSIRIPASLTGTVGHKTTKGRWPTDGVVPLSSTLDTVGALTRTVADSLFFFGAVDPASDGRAALEEAVRPRGPVRLGVPRSALWDACQPDVAAVLDDALAGLARSGWERIETAGALVDEAGALYMEGGIAGAECRNVLERDLPGRRELLHPLVRDRLDRAPTVASPAYAAAVHQRERMEHEGPSLFEGVDLLALPGALLTPPPVRDVEPMERYVEVNAALLRPTCPIGILGLCALTLPVGLDDQGMPVGLQLVGARGRDAELLGLALMAERAMGTAEEVLGRPPVGLREGP